MVTGQATMQAAPSYRLSSDFESVYCTCGHPDCTAEMVRLAGTTSKLFAAIRNNLPLKNFQVHCGTVYGVSTFKRLQLLTLPSLYISETTLYCMSKCALTTGRDIHSYGTRGRDNYRTGRHRMVVYERLPLQAGVHFINRLPNDLRKASTLKALKTRLKRCLASNAFYNVKEFLECDWETTQ
ncbi:hypothetical protein J6590_087640 [Homalodisca vitripennis]|nr:hypothetical protein J6590_087640 [Homalodisca vitripennis]